MKDAKNLKKRKISSSAADVDENNSITNKIEPTTNNEGNVVEQPLTTITSCPFDTVLCQEALSGLKKLIQSAQIGHKQLLDDETPISLYIHVHKIPRCTYLRLISHLPHPLHPLREVCLFVRDDDTNGREYESTVRRYKTMIEQFKLPYHVDVMTLKQLNQELVPYEAKRKLCNRYDLFLADRRILTSLMRGQLLGKHFRHHGKMPLGVNVFNKELKQRLQILSESTIGRMAGSGPLFSIQFTTVNQSVEQGMENFQNVCDLIGKELPGSWMNIHHAYLYGNNLLSLPIYYSKHTKNDVKQLNISMKDDYLKQTHLGELTTLESRNINVIVKPTGEIKFTKKTRLNGNEIIKKRPLKRLTVWYKEKKKSLLPSSSTRKPKKFKKSLNKDETDLVLSTDNRDLIDTAFIQRITEKKTRKKNKQQKHVEQDFASVPAPNAQKRKRLLKTVIPDENNEGGKNNDDAVKMKQSGGRSKKRTKKNSMVVV